MVEENESGKDDEEEEDDDIGDTSFSQSNLKKRLVCFNSSFLTSNCSLVVKLHGAIMKFYNLFLL